MAKKAKKKDSEAHSLPELFDTNQYRVTHPDSKDLEGVNDWGSAREPAREQTTSARELARERETRFSQRSREKPKTSSLADNCSLADDRSLANSDRRKRSPSGWVETYSPSNRQGLYYRYCFLDGRSPKYTHVRGGNINSPEAQRKKAEVEEAIAAGRPPSEIVQLC